MDGYSMPGFAPLYPEGPYEYDDLTAIVFSYPVERRRLEGIVPEPLAVREASVNLSFYDYGVVNGFGSYDELAISVPVTHEGRDLSYAPYLLLDGDAPMAGGREIWGIPKKLGDVTVDPEGAVVTASAARGGTTLVEATLEASEPADEGVFERPIQHNVYRKTIPAAENGAAPVVDRLVLAEVADMTASRVLQGAGTVDFQPSAADPLAVFAPTGEPTGFLVEGLNFTLRRTDDAVLHRFGESLEADRAA
jgi:acetoacetate decarboxylase